LDKLIELDYLTCEDIEKVDLGDNPIKIDYAKLYTDKYKLLRIAYNNSKLILKEELSDYYTKNTFWIREFALFMALKKAHNDKTWQEWEDKYKYFGNPEVEKFGEEHQDELYFWVFTQYVFMKQWQELKQYANKKGIKVIGDLPIYVASDSSDVWAHPDLFDLNKEFKPKTIAGVPPDDFTDTGQLWGNPIYSWEAMKKDDYKFWVDRIRHNLYLYSVLRIDHFKGFESYWEVPNGSLTAVGGRWVKGPSTELFDKIKEELGELEIIAEDLGFQTQEVIDLIENTGFPGMKILQFGFDPLDDSDNLPHNYKNNLVVYTGTHDNKTVNDWFQTASEAEKKYAIEYLNLDEKEGYNWGLIRGVWSSVAYLAIAQLQDFLNLGEEARINTPATFGGNWNWRFKEDDLDKELSDKIARITMTYRRG
jgi:4-alpha-glucanotransferase